MTGKNKPSQKAIDKVLISVLKGLLAMTGDNKPPKDAVDKALILAFDQWRWQIYPSEAYSTFESIISQFLAMTTDNKPSQVCVSALLERAAPDAGGLFQLEALLAMTGDNKPSKNAVDNALILAFGSLEVQALLAMTSDNKPSQEKIEALLIKAAEKRDLSLMQKILALTGDNRPAQSIVEKALEEAVRNAHFKAIPIFLAMREDNKPSPDAINRALVTSSEYCKVDNRGVIETFLTMTTDNKPSQEAISTAFVKLVGEETELWRFSAFWLKTFLVMKTTNKPHQAAVNFVFQRCISRKDKFLVPMFLEMTADNKPNVPDQIEEALCIDFSRDTLRRVLDSELGQSFLRMGLIKPENRERLLKNLGVVLGADVKKMFCKAVEIMDNLSLMHACLSIIPPNILCANLLTKGRENLTLLERLSQKITSLQPAVQNPSLLLYQMYLAIPPAQEPTYQEFITRCLVLLAEEGKHPEAWMTLAIIAQKEGDPRLTAYIEKIVQGARPPKLPGIHLFKPTPDPICQSFVEGTPLSKNPRHVTELMMAMAVGIQHVFPERATPLNTSTSLGANFDTQPDTPRDDPNL